MTVEEEIEFLSGFPEDAIVQINNSDGGMTNIIEEEQAALAGIEYVLDNLI